MARSSVNPNNVAEAAYGYIISFGHLLTQWLKGAPTLG